MRNAQLVQQLQARIRSLEDNERENRALQSKVQRLEAQMKSMVSAAEVEESNTAMKRLQQRLDLATTEQMQHKDAMSKAQQELATANASIADLKSQLASSQLEQELAEAKATIASLEAQLADAQQTQGDQDAQHRQAVARLEKDLAAANANLQQLRAQSREPSADSLAEISTLKQEIAALESVMAAKDAQLHDAQEELDQMDKEQVRSGP